jgi:hypothetical protein
MLGPCPTRGAAGPRKRPMTRSLPTAATSTRLRGRDGMRVVKLLFAGTSLDKARRIFERTTRCWPGLKVILHQPAPVPSRIQLGSPNSVPRGM